MACPAGCCNGTEILCISDPCPISLVVLGIPLQVELTCLRLSSPITLTTAQVQAILQVLIGILGSLGAVLPASL
ncbi:MAG TPA: hypothetical protein VHY08_16830 [Bacillota bacterium]|nr:hypothetical protein [Bacillota bacterium]